ncbi:MAG: HAD family hydrolase [Ruminiclostridium sp.]|nr:HAD family hydrolase [Ruminiclostridium sp.]
MKYKAVIFDLDGTLLNTLSDLADSANHVLSELSLPTHDYESYKYFVGNGIPKLIERCLPADRQELHSKALSMFSEYYALHSKDKTAPYDDIKELLYSLSEKGLKLGVITNKAHDIAVKVVEEYFGRDIFGCIRGLDDSIKAKPDPSGALSVMKCLGVTPSDVLYIGDSGVDMQTAKNAGFTPLGVLWGFRKKDELIENGAEYIARKPLDILKFIE